MVVLLIWHNTVNLIKQVSEIQNLLKKSLYGKNSQWIIAVFIPKWTFPMWHHHSDIESIHMLLYVFVAGERKCKTLTNLDRLDLTFARSWVLDLMWLFQNTKIPLSLLSCSRKDTGLFEVAERSPEGRLHKVGLPFHSPSLACTAIKKETWKHGMSE